MLIRNEIENMKLEKNLVKAAEALFSLEKTASVVSISIAELNFEKAASAYAGYSWDEWLQEDEHVKEALLGKAKAAFQGARGFLGRKGADVAQRVGFKATGKPVSFLRTQSARGYRGQAKALESQAKNMTGANQIAKTQTRAAKASAQSAQQGRMGAQGMKGPAAQAEMNIAKTQQQHASRQLAEASKQTDLTGRIRTTTSNVSQQQKAVAQAEQNLANATTRSGKAQAQAALAEQQQGLRFAQQQQQAVKQQLQQNQKILQTAKSSGPPVKPTSPKPPPSSTPATPTQAAPTQAAPTQATPTQTAAPTTATPPPAGTPPAGTPPAGSPPAAPVAPAEGVNLTNVGYGALGALGLGGLGYAGLKATAPKQPQMIPSPYGMMPKYASWHDIKNSSSSMQQAVSMYKKASVEYRGKTFPGYNQPIASDKKDKKKMVLVKKGDKIKVVHFGQKGYKHNYSKSAKKNYLTRSAGIRNKSGQLTKDDPFSPNHWARKHLWPKRQKADGSALKKEAHMCQNEILKAFKAEGGALAMPALLKHTKGKQPEAEVRKQLKEMKKKGLVEEHPHGDMYTTKKAPEPKKVSPKMEKKAEYDDSRMLSKILERMSAQSEHLKDKIDSGLILPSWAEYKLYNAYNGLGKALGTAYPGEYEMEKDAKQTATKTDPAKWEAAKREAKSRMGGKHSARAMQLATKIYKDKGGGYSGPKPTSSTNSLKKWSKQDWGYSGKDKPGQGGSGVYLPKAKRDRLKSTKAGRKQLAAATRKKHKATAQGKQYSSHGLAAGTSLKKKKK